MDKNGKLSIMFVICEREISDEISDFFSSEIAISATFFAHGTAKQTWLNLLGIGNIDKSLLIFPLPTEDIESIYSILKEQFEIGAGKGIAFTLHVNSIADKRMLACILDSTED